MTPEEMAAEIESLKAALAQLETEKRELAYTNNRLYEYCRKMDRQFSQSVKRELSYREMLFVFNHAQTKDLLQEYIGRAGLKVQYSSEYNFRSN